MAGTIHVVDDDPSFRAALEAGYEVTAHPSAEQLLDHLPRDESGPSCIILDVRLPGISGPDLQRRLIERGSLLPVLFLTGYPDIPTIVNTIKAGAEDFLIKPVNSEQLLRAVEGALAHHKAARDTQAKFDGFRSRLSTLTPRQREVFDLAVREAEQADRQRTRSDRTHHQGSSPRGDGKNGRKELGPTCFVGRASRRVAWWIAQKIELIEAIKSVRNE